MAGSLDQYELCEFAMVKGFTASSRDRGLRVVHTAKVTVSSQRMPWTQSKRHWARHAQGNVGDKGLCHGRGKRDFGRRGEGGVRRTSLL